MLEQIGNKANINKKVTTFYKLMCNFTHLIIVHTVYMGFFVTLDTLYMYLGIILECFQQKMLQYVF